MAFVCKQKTVLVVHITIILQYQCGFNRPLASFFHVKLYHMPCLLYF